MPFFASQRRSAGHNRDRLRPQPVISAAQSTHPGLRHRQSPLYQQRVLVNHPAIRPPPAPMTEHSDNRFGMAPRIVRNESTWTADQGGTVIVALACQPPDGGRDRTTHPVRLIEISFRTGGCVQRAHCEPGPPDRVTGRRPDIPSTAGIWLRFSMHRAEGAGERRGRGRTPCVVWTPAVRSRRPRLSRTRYLRRAKTITTMITMRTTVPMPIYMGNSSHCVVKARLELPQARRRKPPRAAGPPHWPRPARQRWRRPARPLAGPGAKAGRRHQARASRRHGQGRPVRRHEAPGCPVPGPLRPPGSGAGNRAPAPPREHAYWPAGRCTG